MTDNNNYQKNNKENIERKEKNNKTKKIQTKIKKKPAQIILKWGSSCMQEVSKPDFCN